jgi:hypothetical protein
MVQNLLTWIAVVGVVGTVLCGWALCRTRLTAWVLAFCLSIACLATAATTAVLDSLPSAEVPANSIQPPSNATPEQMRIFASMHIPSSAMVGTPALDFTLPRQSDGKLVCLHDLFGNKPIVLIFGSFGCDLFCSRIEGFRKLYEQHHEHAEFLFVYVTQAFHAMPRELQAAIDERARKPNEIQGKRLIIDEGLHYFRLPFTCVTDDDDGSVELAYGAAPQRLVILEPNGVVALDLGRGLPSGLDLDQASSWLNENAD